MSNCGLCGRLQWEGEDTITRLRTELREKDAEIARLTRLLLDQAAQEFLDAHDDKALSEGERDTKTEPQEGGGTMTDVLSHYSDVVAQLVACRAAVEGITRERDQLLRETNFVALKEMEAKLRDARAALADMTRERDVLHAKLGDTEQELHYAFDNATSLRARLGQAKVEIGRLRGALRRGRGCINGLLARTPVRDADETLAEIDAALSGRQQDKQRDEEKR